MEIRERNVIIGVISFIIGLILIMTLIPSFISFFYFSSNIFLNPFTYIMFDILTLAVTLFFYAYFIIRPVRTPKGRENLAVAAMSFGVLLIMLPLISIGFEIFTASYYYGFPFYALVMMIPYLLLIIPGVALLIHGYYMQKPPRTAQNKGT
ncbi:MAG: hypothetical protein ACFE9Z_05525 [Promethearchaeota archaeon]